jgi:hypothetical protein
MAADDVIAKWRGVERKERAASQPHVPDLCRMPGVPDPVSADPTGATRCFERGAADTPRTRA